ncbi:hypothetical protein [Planotetraspora kaengkrachanensis]|uniref:Uncharacterized protein n=1 Tax=Planotetraspora kaengkrachanensis TaxID=575193 RepID=A0A8J3PTN0_9ACTN|nr:hypothetical protein [Planotetraspora kaengkrachanensis]GIG80396.1 hypothetical protein Pka01_35230 [Planotetraspora kaengkrachanensis]
MRDRVMGDLVKGQVCLLVGLLLCVALMPEGLGANNGMSFYGVHWETFLPYAAGLLSAALFTRRALHDAAAASPAPGKVRHAADAFAVLLAGIILTPYTVSGAVDWTHRLLGALLFALQLTLAVRLLAWAHADAFGGAFLLVQLVGGVIAAIYVLQDDGFLLQGEATFQFGFGALLIRTIPLLPGSVLSPSPSIDPTLGDPAVACCGDGDGGSPA